MTGSLKKKIPLIAVNVLLLLAFAACLIASGSIRRALRSQQAATAWAGQSGERFAQLSVFVPESAAFDEGAVYSLREAIDRALLAASLEESEGRALYTDAWSAESAVSVSGKRGSAQVTATGVGGDFFLFHPLYLKDGSYLSPDDLMRDRVVLDEELAWRLFGSASLAGLEVTIGGRPYVIAGVISREDDFWSSKAYSGGAGMFMSYEALRELSDSELGISCYELTLADPITGFALKTLTDAFPYQDAHIVENSARYTLESAFKSIGSFGERSMRTDGMVYPYWENAARYTEDWLALLLILELALVAFPAACFVIYGVRIVRFMVKRGRRAAIKKIDERDEREAEKYKLEHADEFVVHDIADIVREFLEEQDANGP